MDLHIIIVVAIITNTVKIYYIQAFNRKRRKGGRGRREGESEEVT